jgi:hypothetical protein
MRLNIKQRSQLKAMWFSRWLAMNYSDVLNTTTGEWYASQLQHFEKHIFKEWLIASKNRTSLNHLGIEITDLEKTINLLK